MRSLSGIPQGALGRAWKNLIPGLAGSRILLRGMEASRTPSLGAFPAPKAKEFLWMAFVALVIFPFCSFFILNSFPIFFFFKFLFSPFQPHSCLPIPKTSPPASPISGKTVINAWLEPSNQPSPHNPEILSNRFPSFLQSIGSNSRPSSGNFLTTPHQEAANSSPN